MASINGKMIIRSRAPKPESLISDDVRAFLSDPVRGSTDGVVCDVGRTGARWPLFVTANLSIVGFVCLLGCQSAQDKAGASDASVATTAKLDTTTSLKSNAPSVTQPKNDSAPAAKPATPTSEKPDSKPTLVPTTAAEPAAKPAEPVAKPAVPAQAVTEGMIVAARTAFEANKCGTCHFVGEFPAVRPSTAKIDLGGVGITRSSEWIASFLQKKEKLDGKFHMKTFAGTDAERDVLSQWLAAQKAEPLPMKPPGSK